MDSHTTYSKSYMDTPGMPAKEKPIIPRAANILPSTDEFLGKTVYSESFLPCETEFVAPVVPSNNISLSNDRMACDTTNKVGYALSSRFTLFVEKKIAHCNTDRSSEFSAFD